MFNPAHKVRSEIHKSLAKLQLCPEVEFPRTFVRRNKNSYTEDELRYKMLPTAIIRFQLLLLDLLAYEYIKCGEHWEFDRSDIFKIILGDEYSIDNNNCYNVLKMNEEMDKK